MGYEYIGAGIPVPACRVQILARSNMPSAAAEAEAAAMDNAVDVWRLNTASRLQRSPVYVGQSIIFWW